MQNELDMLNEIRTPSGAIMENFEAVAKRVIADIKAEDRYA